MIKIVNMALVFIRYGFGIPNNLILIHNMSMVLVFVGIKTKFIIFSLLNIAFNTILRLKVFLIVNFYIIKYRFRREDIKNNYCPLCLQDILKH